MTPTNKMAQVIYLCWTMRVTTKSDTARTQADWIAASASEGYLTTRLGEDEYSRQWLPTPVGLEYLETHTEGLVF
jgi:hypothetical protein